MEKITCTFYRKKDVVLIAKELIGKILVTRFDGILTAGRIVETEAYNGVTDKASHAYGARRTNRTEIMYANGGVAYVYLCNGMHHLFNVVTAVANEPHAVLIRAVEPVTGIDAMLLRTKKTRADYTLTKGPGNVSKALGIKTIYSGFDLCGDVIFIADDGFIANNSSIKSTARIGVDYAGKDALLPYRLLFYRKVNM